MASTSKGERGSRKRYPSEVTREQNAVIEAQLAGARKATRPRKHDLYDIFCALLYVLREGCRWRALPSDYPGWENVYHHFRIWKEPGEGGESLLERVLRRLVEEQREKDGRKRRTSLLIADSRSVKNAERAEESGYDAGKKNIGDKAPHSGGHRRASPRPLR